jgi:high affinity Mn2+ porin
MSGIERISRQSKTATRRFPRRWALLLARSVMPMVAAALCANQAFADGLMVTKAPPAPKAPASYDWSGFYAGGHFGYGWGSSHWSTPGSSGAFGLAHPIDTFNESGSFFLGVQAGYQTMFANRVVIGAEIDGSFPSWPDLNGLSIGGISTLPSAFGPETYSETMRSFGTVRGRLGYAPGSWLFYATGGFAWAYDRLTLTQLNTGANEAPFLWRFGWAAGAGVETPIAPHWTAKLEYLFTDYGNSTVTFPGVGAPFTANFTLQELRAGVDYQFGNGSMPENFIAPGLPDKDQINIHGQMTLTEQGNAAFHAPYFGTNSLPNVAEGRETFDATLFAGVRLWRGAEFWIDPEIDQGFGLGDAHGIAGYTSGEAYKLGSSYPYARVQRYFVRQTVDLGGDSEKVEADVNQFAGSQTANRLVLWLGKFSIADVFDTNKYANNPKSDFLNWSLINAGTFDYAGDAWGYSYGTAAEWYQGQWAVRGGVFDMSVTPAGGAGNAASYGLDPTFAQFQMIGEVENRYEFWGQPGKLKVTGFVIRGRAGNLQDAADLSLATGLDASTALAALRKYQSRPGVSVNLEQQLTEEVGLFARAGWADGEVETWDFADIDRTASAGLSIAGKQWGRPNDTIGIAGVVNGISSAHRAYFNAGGLGLLIGDGQLPNYGVEQIVETYYSYALTDSTKLSFDYQFIANPGYNADRGPVNVFSGRLHASF